MADTATEKMVKALIEAQVIQALNSAPDAIEKLVKAALSSPVDPHTGRPDGHSFNKVPYLDWIVGDSIRSATQDAVRKIVLESVPLIEGEVRKGLASDTIVSAITKSFVDTASQDWRISVNFEADNKRR